MPTDIGHLHGEHVFVGLLEGVVHLRGGVRQIGIVVHGQIVRQGIHGGQAEGSRQFDTNAVRGNMVRSSAKFIQRDGDLVMIVHAGGIVTLVVEVDPLGLAFVLCSHIADYTAVAIAPATVDADDLIAQNAIAIAELDAGLLGIGLGIGCRAILGIGIETVGVTLVHPRTVGAVGGNGDDLIDVLLAAPGDVGRPQGAAGLQAAVVAHAGAVVLGIDGNVERQVLGLPQVALAQRVVVSTIHHILHVGHFPHEVEVVVIIGTIQCVQINRNLIHGVRAVHTRIVVGGALRNQHGAIPVGQARTLAGRKVDGLLHAVADLIRSILRSKMLVLDRHLLQGDGATQLIALLDLRTILGCGTGHLDGNGFVFGKRAADGNAFTVLEGAGLAFGSGVLQVVGVLGVQRHLHAFRREFRGCGVGINARLGLTLCVEDAHGAALGGAGDDLAALNHKLAAVDLIRVGAVIKAGGESGKVLLTGHIGDDHAVVLHAILGVALNHDALLVAVAVRVGAAVLQMLGLAVHGIAEVIHRHHGLVLPHVVTGVAQLGLLSELRPEVAVLVLTAGFLRTVEV